MSLNNIQRTYKRLFNRGPDIINSIKRYNYTFTHFLLHITGMKAPQPFIKDDIICLYNGQLYNYKDFGDYKSDNECLIDLYQQHNHEFIKFLDGEFAIVLFDFNKNIIILSTDIFATKPLWYSINHDKQIAICSYESPLEDINLFTEYHKIVANTTLIFDIHTMNITNQFTVYDFDLTQYKTNLDDWNLAFENAIIKRTQNKDHPIFITLSSGYDSGTIACCLNKLNIKYNSYTILGKENEDIIEKRLKLNKPYLNNTYIKQINRSERNYYREYVENNVEPAHHTLMINEKPSRYMMIRDGASWWLSYIFDRAIKKKQKIYLSGQGGDEIYSDYGFNGLKMKANSTINGIYSENLEDIYPWFNFYHGTMEGFISKEEHVGGSFGIECRYPFLDKDVVQEFLWLKHDIKNEYYKSSLYHYMKKYNYPFDLNKKIGFRLNKLPKINK